MSSSTTTAAGLPPVFVTIVAEHTARVWRFLRYQGVPEADLPDGSQEVFLVVHRRLPEFRGDAALTTWLYEICLHVGRARRRKHAARREDLGVVADDVGARRGDLGRARAVDDAHRRASRQQERAEEGEAHQKRYEKLATGANPAKSLPA